MSDDKIKGIGGLSEMAEALNLPDAELNDFTVDLKYRLMCITGLVDFTDDNGVPTGLTLEDIRKPMMVLGSPGVGKTASIKSVIDELNKKYDLDIDLKVITLGQMGVGELGGIILPDKSQAIPTSQAGKEYITRAVRAISDDLPPMDCEEGSNPKYKKYGVLFFDELTTCDEWQILPFTAFADVKRGTGIYKLPEHWLVVAAGNGPGNSNCKPAGLQQFVISRTDPYVINLNYENDFRPYAVQTKIDPMILAYLDFKPENASVDEASDCADEFGKQSPCPRQWEDLDKMLKIARMQKNDIGVQNKSADRIARMCVGNRVGADFTAFTAYGDKLQYDAKKIVDGTEKMVDDMIKPEEFYILKERIIAILGERAEKVLTPDELKSTLRCNNPDLMQYLKNVLTWTNSLVPISVEFVTNLIYAVCHMPVGASDNYYFGKMCVNKKFVEICPVVNELFDMLPDLAF